MVDEQPALIGFDGDRAGADLGALPAGDLKLGRTHDVAVLAPEHQVRALADEDVAEGGVAGIGGPGKHQVLVVYLPGEQQTVAVIGQEGVFQLVEGLEVLGPAHADGGAVVAVAPGDVVLAIQEADPGVIAVFLPGHILVALKNDGVITDVPVDAILGETHEDIHLDGAAVAAKNTGEAVTKGHHRAVEYTVGTLRGMAANNGVFGVAPHGHGITLGPVLPGDILEFVSNDPAHK